MYLLTLTLLRGRFPLNQVINAGGREPADSQKISYLLSAVNGLTGFKISTVSGFTEKRNSLGKLKIQIKGVPG